MKNESIITADGFVALARIFVSCRPIMSGTLTANQLCLIEKAKSERDVVFSDFVKRLPIPDPTYQQILSFAESNGQGFVDAKIVWRFFGGEPHFKKILGQIEEYGLKKDFAMKIFFAHILIPIEVLRVEGGLFDGIYRNGDVEVRIKNLVPALPASDVLIGGKALVHYASMISVDFSKEIKEDLLRAQANNTEFVKACKYVKEIDYNDFWGLCEWTKNTVRERGLQ